MQLTQKYELTADISRSNALRWNAYISVRLSLNG